MKVSKKLLESIAVGLIVVATATSCEKNDVFASPKEVSEEACEVVKDLITTGETQVHTDFNCPACGMG